MFGLDPLSLPVAIVEMLLLLSLAAFIGWFIARLILSGRLNSLRADITERERELAECRQSKVTIVPPVAPSYIAPTSVTTQTVVLASVTDDIPTQAYSESRPIVPLAIPIFNESPPMPIAQGSEAAVLSRIASRAGELNFDRIGIATSSEADDLKAIIGIGPFLERKLHSLGIYTFRQVSNFTKEDLDKVNELIEFFPGRIERDNWVGQSKVFYDQKNG